MYDKPWPGDHAISVEVKQFTSKTEHYVRPFSLSLPCEIFCFKPVFGACSYAVSNLMSLHL